MGTAEWLTVLGIGMLTAGTLALVFTLGKWWGERGAARDYVDRLHAMNQVERMRRGAHLPAGAVWVEPGQSFAMNSEATPVHLDGRRTARENMTIDLGEVIRMAKHRDGEAAGTSNQQAEAKKAQEAAELKALERKLRQQGKIK